MQGGGEAAGKVAGQAAGGAAEAAGGGMAGALEGAMPYLALLQGFQGLSQGAQTPGQQAEALSRADAQQRRAAMYANPEFQNWLNYYWQRR